MKSLDQQLSDVFQKYMEINKSLPADLIKKKSGDMAFKLFENTADHAAKKSKIAQDVRKLGWRAKMPKSFRANPEFKRKPGEKDGNQALQRYINAVIKVRQNGIKYIAVGWLVAARALGVATKTKARNDNPKGKFSFKSSGHSATAVMQNYTPGVETLSRKFGITDVAIQAVIDDMQLYISTKLSGKSGASVGGRR